MKLLVKIIWMTHNFIPILPLLPQYVVYLWYHSKFCSLSLIILNVKILYDNLMIKIKCASLYTYNLTIVYTTILQSCIDNISIQTAYVRPQLKLNNILILSTFRHFIYFLLKSNQFFLFSALIYFVFNWWFKIKI